MRLRTKGPSSPPSRPQKQTFSVTSKSDDLSVSTMR